MLSNKDLELFNAISADHSSETKELDQLVAQGANPNCFDEGGYTCLHEAALWGFISNIEWLVNNHNCDVNVQTDYGDTPLHTAAKSGNLETMIWLAKNGADISTTNNGYETPEDYLKKHDPYILPEWQKFIKSLNK